MDFTVQYLSFFVVRGADENETAAGYKHYQTLDEAGYLSSALKDFLDGEFARIVKRKVDRNPKNEQAPTKIGRFIVESGYELESNPNYNLFARLQEATTKEDFRCQSEELARAYANTSAVRGGALIVARAKLDKYFDKAFIFIMKCDFEPKIATITDESSLISQVEMAISAKNMKLIQYPHMPEEGMVEEWELKIHQASHARYFEDFLKFVQYEKSLPEIMNTQVMGLVQQYIEMTYEAESEERRQEEEAIELWAASEKRELQKKWSSEQVIEAAAALVEQRPDLEMKLKLDHIAIKALLADFGENIHIARLGERYVVLIEGNTFQFEKGVSPVELLRPDELEDVLARIRQKQTRGMEDAIAEDDKPPF
ncbi:hypothetical protein ACH33_10255 [Aneurinibacillus sp. XH2]|uniref:DUF3900 domain-containing protein n=1 Tax=Aneurinibacillus sp. XH2 TaxID=1450761 RepID=UPI00070C5B82|nr:DUF3900 domain-containing protein [Aneurinibacillus sp. XH2]AMA73203.1 hypothetical protein ACH33_10255 [Aneurinibacillus sp. XH2]